MEDCRPKTVMECKGKNGATLYSDGSGRFYRIRQKRSKSWKLSCHVSKCKGTAAMKNVNSVNRILEHKQSHNPCCKPNNNVSVAFLLRTIIMERVKRENIPCSRIFQEECSRFRPEVSALLSFSKMESAMLTARRAYRKEQRELLSSGMDVQTKSTAGQSESHKLESDDDSWSSMQSEERFEQKAARNVSQDSTPSVKLKEPHSASTTLSSLTVKEEPLDCYTASYEAEKTLIKVEEIDISDIRSLSAEDNSSSYHQPRLSPEKVFLGNTSNQGASQSVNACTESSLTIFKRKRSIDSLPQQVKTKSVLHRRENPAKETNLQLNFVDVNTSNVFAPAVVSAATCFPESIGGDPLQVNSTAIVNSIPQEHYNVGMFVAEALGKIKQHKYREKLRRIVCNAVEGITQEDHVTYQNSLKDYSAYSK